LTPTPWKSVHRKTLLDRTTCDTFVSPIVGKPAQQQSICPSNNHALQSASPSVVQSAVRFRILFLLQQLIDVIYIFDAIQPRLCNVDRYKSIKSSINASARRPVDQQNMADENQDSSPPLPLQLPDDIIVMEILPYHRPPASAASRGCGRPRSRPRLSSSSTSGEPTAGHRASPGFSSVQAMCHAGNKRASTYGSPAVQ
jgi:hypothetical protein